MIHNRSPRCRAAIIAALSFALLPLAASPLPVNAQGHEPLVLAFYYNWFDERSWSPDGVPDLPLSPYVSRDRGAMGRHIDQAKAAGIDALVVNWWGPREENNQTETNFRAMLDEAAARGFRLALDVDMNSPFLRSSGDVQAALAHVLGTHAQHPAYLRSGGKPVIFFYHQCARLGVQTWAAIRQAVDPDRNSLWIEEGVDVSPLSVFDGHHLYSVTWANRADMARTANKYARLVRSMSEKLGVPKVYVATVMPGYDDTRAGRGSAAFAVGREGGAYYERSWRAAIDSAPDWIIINSFNEWKEGTFIEPSQGCGNQYLDLTAVYAAAFRNSAPPPPPPPPPPAPTAVAEATVVVEPTATKAAPPTPTPVPRPLPPTPTATPPPPIDRPVRLGDNGPWAM